MMDTKHGQRVALIGLDGSGKSANISYMKKAEAYRGFSFLWVRWEPTLLKPAYLLMNSRMKHSKPAQLRVQSTTEKDSREQRAMQEEYQKKSGMKARLFRNPLVRGGWMTLALIDYVLQFYAKAGGVLMRGDAVVFDRYYLDLFVDQGISFGYSPERIWRELHRYQRLFPEMDKTIYLRVSPEVCYRRKDDIPGMDYLLRRHEIYEYLSRRDGWQVVDGELPFDAVCAEIRSRILPKEQK